MLSCESIYLTEYILLNLLTVFMTHPSRQAPYAGFAHKFMSNRAKVATFHFALSIGGSHRCDSNKLSCTYNSQPQDDAFKEIAPTRCLLRTRQPASLGKFPHTKYNVYDPCHVFYNCCQLRLSLRQMSLAATRK